MRGRGTRSVYAGRQGDRQILDSLKGKPLDPRDGKGLLLGLHGKTIDELLGVHAATRAGSLGPAMTGARVIFETYAVQRYLLQGDFADKVKACRLAGIEHTLKDTRERILAGDPTGRNMEMLFQLSRARADFDDAAASAWTGRGVLQLAEDVGLTKMYVSLYRMASAIIHARDGDEYNPYVIASMKQQFPWEQPYFLTGFGFWGAGDAIALAGFLDAVPMCLFAATARVFDLQLTKAEEELVEMLERIVTQDAIGGSGYLLDSGDPNR